MKTLILSAILVLTSLTGMAQEKKNSCLTCGAANGVFWSNSSEETKRAYIMGYFEGKHEAPDDGKLAPLTSLTYGATSVEVSSFYRDHPTFWPVGYAIYYKAIEIRLRVADSELYLKRSLAVVKDCDAASKSAK